MTNTRIIPDIYKGPGHYQTEGGKVVFVEIAPPEMQVDVRLWFKVSEDEEARKGRGSYLMPGEGLLIFIVRPVALLH